MNRREFLKRAGTLTAAVAGGSSMMLLDGFANRPRTHATAATTKLVFEDKETLEAIRAKIEANGYRFTVGRTRDYDEFGYPGTPPEPLPDLPPLSVAVPPSDVMLGGVPPLPSAFDLRNINGHSYIGPMQYQDGTNLCWDFALCDAASSAYNRKNGLYDGDCAILSPMYVAWVLKGGSGKGLSNAYMFTKSGCPYETPTGLEGACDSIDFPFASFLDNVGGITPPRFLIEKAKLAPRVTMRRCAMVYPLDYNETTVQIKAAIYNYGAVKASVRQSPAAFKAYKSGVYEDTFTEPDAEPYYNSHTGHDVSLVGWDDNPPEGGGGCWILRNEWGTAWGENGYMRISYFSALINTAAVFFEAGSPGDKDLIIRGNVAVDGDTYDCQTIVTLSGDDAFAVATDTGKYAFQGLNPGRYVLTPTQPRVIFSPLSQEIVLSEQNVADINFTGTRI